MGTAGRGFLVVAEMGGKVYNVAEPLPEAKG